MFCLIKILNFHRQVEKLLDEKLSRHRLARFVSSKRRCDDMTHEIIRTS